MSSYSYVSHVSSRLDLFLSKMLSNDFSRTEIQNFILDGKVCVNDKITTRRSFGIRIGDRIKIECTSKQVDTTLQPKEMQIDVVYENENLLVINKSANLTVHPGAGNTTNTLVNGLLYMEQKGMMTLSNERGYDRLGIVHRLDKDTSGLMIIAKNNKVHRLLSDMMKTHSIDRRYLALCHGIPNRKEDCIRSYIHRNKKNIKKMCICDKDDYKAKLAITHYKLLLTIDDGKNGQLSLIECRLETGRTHQIRLHMQSIGHPLVGEQLYTSSHYKKMDVDNGYLHQMLHSYKLNFIDPISKEKVSCENWSDEFREIAKKANKVLSSQFNSLI